MILKLYSRPGCHLCEEMATAIRRVAQAGNVAAEIEEVDISADPNLEERYGLEIPVLEIDGRRIAKYRISDDALRRALGAR
jgi:thiol-disulfide isomerase/thioredoxin